MGEIHWAALWLLFLWLLSRLDGTIDRARGARTQPPSFLAGVIFSISGTFRQFTISYLCAIFQVEAGGCVCVWLFLQSLVISGGGAAAVSALQRLLLCSLYLCTCCF